MDLIDRYLVAIRHHLPPPQQKDIAEELEDSLRSEAEDTARTLGRPLTAEEQAALLRKRGHPWLAASRYLPQQYLVGPALYPYYRQALTIVIFWIVLPVTLGVGALLAIYAPDSSQTWARVLGRAWMGSLYGIGIVTSVFAVLEHQRVRITALDRWEPASLPVTGNRRAVPRTETVISLVFSLTMLMWWTELIRLPDIFKFSVGSIRFVAAPIWTSMFVPVLITVLASVALTFVDLVRPWRTLPVSVARIAVSLGSAGIVAVIVRAGHWVDISRDPPGAGTIVRDWMNPTIEWSLIIAAGIMLIEAFLEVRAVLRARMEGA